MLASNIYSLFENKKNRIEKSFKIEFKLREKLKWQFRTIYNKYLVLLSTNLNLF